MAERISRALLPDNTSVADDGMAMFGGVRVDDLVAQFGTPLFVYDEDHIRRRCQEAVKAFPDGVSYASKAFLCKACKPCTKHYWYSKHYWSYSTH